MALDLVQVGANLFNAQAVAEAIGGMVFGVTGAMVCVVVVIRMVKGRVSASRRRGGSGGSKRVSNTRRYGNSYRRQSYKNHVSDRI